MPDKRPAAERDNEDAPLLANGAASDDEQAFDNAGTEDDAQKSSPHRSFRSYLASSGRWVLRNRMVVAILCLLFGGFIALCVYFGGELTFEHPALFELWRLSTTAIYKSQPEETPEDKPKTATICVTPACGKSF